MEKWYTKDDGVEFIAPLFIIVQPKLKVCVYVLACVDDLQPTYVQNISIVLFS